MYIEMFLSANRSVLEEHLGFLQVAKSLECIRTSITFWCVEGVCGT